MGRQSPSVLRSRLMLAIESYAITLRINLLTAIALAADPAAYPWVGSQLVAIAVRVVRPQSRRSD
jgi:hypothetical protein